MRQEVLFGGTPVVVVAVSRSYGVAAYATERKRRCAAVATSGEMFVVHRPLLLTPTFVLENCRRKRVRGSGAAARRQRRRLAGSTGTGQGISAITLLLRGGGAGASSIRERQVGITAHEEGGGRGCAANQNRPSARLRHVRPPVEIYFPCSYTNTWRQP